MARKSLGTIIHNMLTTVSDDGKPCALITLVHQSGNHRTEIHKAVITSAKPSDPDQLGEMFKGIADTNAQDRQGVQYYVLLAFFEGTSEAFTEHPFKCRGEEDPYNISSESPDLKGIVTQQMRLLEVTFRSSLLHSESMLRTLAEHNERLMHENADAITIVKDMLFEKVNNEQARAVELRRLERSTEERKALLKLAPALLNQITGKEVFPQATADTALLETIAEKITPEQIMEVAKILPPEITGLLYARFESHMKAVNEKKGI